MAKLSPRSVWYGRRPRDDENCCYYSNCSSAGILLSASRWSRLLGAIRGRNNKTTETLHPSRILPHQLQLLAVMWNTRYCCRYKEPGSTVRFTSYDRHRVVPSIYVARGSITNTGGGGAFSSQKRLPKTLWYQWAHISRFRKHYFC